MKNKYILIGIPNSGKSTLGKRVAAALNFHFFDLDKMARDKMDPEYRYRILSFVAAFMFQDELYNSLVEVSEIDGPAIIETGAEAALLPKCADIMKEIGTIILSIEIQISCFQM